MNFMAHPITGHVPNSPMSPAELSVAVAFVDELITLGVLVKAEGHSSQHLSPFFSPEVHAAGPIQMYRRHEKGASKRGVLCRPGSHAVSN